MTSFAVSKPALSHFQQIFSELVNGSLKDEHLTTISVNINTIGCFIPQQSLFDWWVWIQKLWRERSNAFRSESLHFFCIETYDTNRHYTWTSPYIVLILTHMCGVLRKAMRSLPMKIFKQYLNFIVHYILKTILFYLFS